MPAMATALTEFADNGNSRTYSTAGHTAVMPKLVIQKRKVPTAEGAVAELHVTVVHGTVDPDNLVLPSKVAFEASVRYPSNGDAADIAAALVIFRDIVASDEFGASVTSQNWIE